MPQTLLMTRRWTQLLVGLFLYGIAIAMMVRAAIGISPWDVLAQGISLRTGILFGIVTNLVGFFVLLLWIPLKERLGIGTALNALLKPGDLNALALLNSAGEVVASVGTPIDFDTRNLIRTGEYWGRQTVSLMNLIDLGTNITSEVDGARPTIIVQPPEMHDPHR